MRLALQRWMILKWLRGENKVSHLKSIIDFSQRTDDGLIVTEADLLILVRDAFERGAATAREADYKILCSLCADEMGVIRHECSGHAFSHPRITPVGGEVFYISCTASTLRTLSLPEMTE